MKNLAVGNKLRKQNKICQKELFQGQKSSYNVNYVYICLTEQTSSALNQTEYSTIKI